MKTELESQEAYIYLYLCETVMQADSDEPFAMKNCSIQGEKAWIENAEQPNFTP